MMKRTFFAIDIHPDERLNLVFQDVRNHLAGEKIKWVSADLMHLTLKFLGDTPDDTIPEIIHSVNLSVCEMPVMNLHLTKVGLFRNLHNPRVIWIGIAPCLSLEQTVQSLGDILVTFGFPEDRVEFVPHLTLGRIKGISQPEKLAGLLEKYKNESFGTVCVREVIYYESILKPEGPDYHPLACFPLRG